MLSKSAVADFMCAKQSVLDKGNTTCMCAKDSESGGKHVAPHCAWTTMLSGKALIVEKLCYVSQ